MNLPEMPDSDELLTTGEAARLLGSSRQHVVDLCDRGRLPYRSTGRHRRIRRADVLALRDGPTALTTEQLKSLWLHHAVAAKVLANPERALRLAHRNLERLMARHPRGQAARQLNEWKRILDGPLHDVLDVLTERSGWAIELRQNSPFAGVLSPAERARVLRAHRQHATGRTSATSGT